MDLSRYTTDANTPLHGTDGRVKTVLFLAAAILASTLSDWRLALGLWLGATALFASLRLGLRDLLVRLAIPLGVAWVVFLSVLFTYGHHPLFSINLDFFTLTAWREGAMRGLLLFNRIMAAVTFGTLLAFSTPMIEILETLRLLKIPGVVIDIADMMHRYIFILQDTAVTMRRAQLSRMCDDGSWLQRVGDVGRMASGVLIKSLDRGTRIYAAMLARGYSEDSAEMSFFTRPISNRDKLVGGLGAALLALIATANLRLS